MQLSAAFEGWLGIWLGDENLKNSTLKLRLFETQPDLNIHIKKRVSIRFICFVLINYFVRKFFTLSLVLIVSVWYQKWLNQSISD